MENAGKMCWINVLDFRSPPEVPVCGMRYYLLPIDFETAIFFSYQMMINTDIVYIGKKLRIPSHSIPVELPSVYDAV